MITVIIKDNGEPNVIKLTYENLYKELKDINDSKLIVSASWFDALSKVKTPYVCFVEPDCLVSSGYFSSLLGLYTKSSTYHQLAVMGSKIGVNNWANNFYAYEVGDNYSDGIIPCTDKKSSAPYPVQIAYIPGALIRTKRLVELLGKLKLNNGSEKDLVHLSAELSLGFWRIGRRVNVNPNTAYVTTEDYVNDITKYDFKTGDLVSMFKKESI